MKNLKIATLTFHRAINYGALFQTYALQKSIQKFGYDSEVLDYRSEFLEELHKPYNLKLYRTPLHFLYSVYKNRVKRDNRKTFRKFMNENIALSSISYNKDSIKDAEKDYDAIFTGSDQVWNCNCTKFDKTYFLDFTDNKSKKYSYAASMGIKLEKEELKKEYKYLLKDFKVLSVREKQAAEELSGIGLNSEVVLDPTVLLTSEEWMKLARRPEGFVTDKKFLLVYVIVETPTLFKKAKSIAKEKGLEVVYINEMILNKPGIRNLHNVAPEEWLWLFHNAEFIVTNSFHGTAFSVNFKKQFIVEPLPVKTNANSRILDFLELFKISDRVVDGMEASVKSQVDYEKIDIEFHRGKSLESLRRSLYLIGNEEQ